MKNIKRILSILMVCAMLMMVLPMTVSAAGTQDDPINANDKWFGYGANCYLLNPTIAEGTTDGLWYTFTPNQDGILVLEHKYKDVDYDITIDWYGVPYTGGAVDGVIYNGPIMTLPVSVDDPITVHITTKDAAAGTVYANMKIVTGTVDDPIKVKSKGLTAYVGSGQTVYFQDDTLNADYATKGLLVESPVTNETVFYTVSKNATSGAVAQTAFTDTDGDGIIKATLGGSLGSAGAPLVKPMWAIENNNTEGMGSAYTLTIVDSAHECVYDDVFDTECNTCGEYREPAGVTCSGSSISEDVNGLAMQFSLQVEGMEQNGTEAIYDNATVGGYKLIGMGAVVWNDGSETMYTIEDADNLRIINVPAVYLCNLTQNSASFAIRVINIPDEGKDTLVRFRSYLIYEDAEGMQHTIYCHSAADTYN